MDIKDSYIVLSKKDIEKYLNENDVYQLNYITNKLKIGRIKDRFDATETFIVVSNREEYFAEIEEIVEREEYYKHY